MGTVATKFGTLSWRNWTTVWTWNFPSAKNWPVLEA
jgi:hypothetical protein